MTSPSARFSAAVELAMSLPTPRAIAQRIMASTEAVDDGLRATSYDGPFVKGGGGGSHPERMLARRNPSQFPPDNPDAKTPPKPQPQRRALTSTERDHILTVSKASERFVVAIASLMVEVLERVDVVIDDYTWDEAVKDGWLISQSQQGGTLRAALDLTDRDAHRWVRQAVLAVRDLRLVAGRYSGRDADPWEQYKQAGGRIEEICEVHAALRPPMFKPKHGRAQLCKTCADLRRLAGKRPPPELVHVLERGSQVEYRKARSRWLQECGVMPDDGRMTG